MAPVGALSRISAARAIPSPFSPHNSERRQSGEPRGARSSLEYDFYVFHPGKTRVLITALPTLRIHPGRHLRYAVAIDDSSPRWSTWKTRAGGKTRAAGRDHRRVGCRCRQAGKAHAESLDDGPGVVLDKIVLDFGGLKPSYLGPPETSRAR